jgi:hypothetical protein
MSRIGKNATIVRTDLDATVIPKIRRLKSALSFFVINYGLKSVAWSFTICVINKCPCHWLQPVVDDELLLSTEFVRRLKIRESEPPGEPKSGAGAKCGVQLLRAEKFFGSAEALPSKTTYYSLLTIRCRSTSRQSLFAIRFRFGSAGASPSHCFLA